MVFKKAAKATGPKKFNSREKNNNSGKFEKKGKPPARSQFKKPESRSKPEKFEGRKFEKPEGRKFEKPEGRKFEKPEGRKFDKPSDKKFEKPAARKFDKPESRVREAAPERKEYKEKKDRSLYIWGRHPVTALLAELEERSDVAHKDYALHVIVDKTGKAPAQLKDAYTSAKNLGFPVKSHKSLEDDWPLDPDGDFNHQRVALRVPNIPTNDIHDAVEIVRDSAKIKGCIGVVLDQIQDPHNFGAILRSAAFFNLKFVIYASDRQASITPTVIKSSAGGAFSIKLVPVVNLARALDQLKEVGAWVVGTVVNAEQKLSDVPLDRPYLVVMGNEQKGIRPEVEKRCDYKVGIPGGNISVDSLNVSVASGILFNSLKPEESGV